MTKDASIYTNVSKCVTNKKTDKQKQDTKIFTIYLLEKKERKLPM